LRPLHVQAGGRLARLHDRTLMQVAVIDYGSGNLASAARGLVLAAERLGISAEINITSDPDAVAKADRIVLPGQGAFADCAPASPASTACANRC